MSTTLAVINEPTTAVVLSGSFRVISLTTLIQFLTALGKTGKLRVCGDGYEGELVFKDGHVAPAVVGLMQDISVLEALMAAGNGTFTFTSPAQAAPGSAVPRLRWITGTRTLRSGSTSS